MKALLVLLLASVGAFGQDIKSSGRPVPMPHYEVQYPDEKPAPKPLKCGKYEHIQHLPARCANTCEPGSSVCTTGCLLLSEETTCAPDMHEVTEKEWQALMERLKTIEKRQQIDGWPAAGKE